VFRCFQEATTLGQRMHQDDVWSVASIVGKVHFVGAMQVAPCLKDPSVPRLPQQVGRGRTSRNLEATVPHCNKYSATVGISRKSSSQERKRATRVMSASASKMHAAESFRPLGHGAKVMLFALSVWQPSGLAGTDETGASIASSSRMSSKSSCGTSNPCEQRTYLRRLCLGLSRHPTSDP